MNENKVLATVNGKDITNRDVDFLMQSLGPQGASQFNSPEGRMQLLNELINQELLYLEALEKGVDKEEGYLNELERVKADLLKQYSLRKLLGSVSVTEGEILDYYNQNKDKFNKPESVKANHILVDTKEKAEEILNEIKEGLDFQEAARKYSSCPSKNNGGNLGYFTRGRMVPEFEEAAFKMNKGDISNPVKTQFGYHLIEVTDKKEPQISKFDEVRDQIYQILLGKRQNEIYLKKTRELKDNYEVLIKE